MIHEDNEPALLLSSFVKKEESGELFLNEENVSPKLKTKGREANQSML